MANRSVQFYRNLLRRFLTILPILCCLIALGYQQYRILEIDEYFGSDSYGEINSRLTENITVTFRNTTKINDIHNKIIEHTLYKFRPDDMQEWIETFKDENPELDIPDFNPTYRITNEVE